MKRLNKKVVIITGGSRGIGYTMCKMFANEGATVVALSRKPPKTKNKNIHFMSLDVTNYQSCNKVAKIIYKKYKKIDVLINNAGIMKDLLTEKMLWSDFDLVIKTNTYGTFNMTKSVIPYFLKQKEGNIINISSFVAQSGNFGQANYVASKAAVEGMTKCWSREFSRHGENIRVNAIAPGVIKTDIFKNTKPEILENLKKKSMLKRLTTAEEISKVAIFLASDDSSCITGATIHADCGVSI